MRQVLALVLFSVTRTLFASDAGGICPDRGDVRDVVLENACFRLRIGGDATIRSLVVNATGEDEIGMRPDILECLLAKATAFSSPLTVAADMRQLDASPYAKENLAVIKLWQEARKAGFFTAAVRREMEDPDRDFHLARTPDGFALESKRLKEE